MELVEIIGFELRRRKKGGKINQVYYTTSTGITKHASFFKRISNLKTFTRNLILEEILKK